MGHICGKCAGVGDVFDLAAYFNGWRRIAKAGAIHRLHHPGPYLRNIADLQQVVTYRVVEALSRSLKPCSSDCPVIQVRRSSRQVA